MDIGALVFAACLGIAMPAAPAMPAAAPQPIIAARVDMRPMTWALSAYAGMSVADHALTYGCISSGRCREVGALKGIKDPAAMTAVAVAIDAGVMWYLSERAHHGTRKQRKAAFWTTVALTIVKAGVVGWGISVTTRGRR